MYETTIRQFEKLGYACLPTLVSSEEIDAMCLEMEAMVSGAPLGPQSSNDRDGNPVPFPTDFSYHDHNNAPLLIRISNQLRRSALMRIVYANPSLLLLVEALFGPKFVPFAESIIVKLPGTGAPIWYPDCRSAFRGPRPPTRPAGPRMDHRRTRRDAPAPGPRGRRPHDRPPVSIACGSRCARPMACLIEPIDGRLCL